MEEARENRQRVRLSFKIAAIYAAVGALYIFFSDRVAAVFSDTPQGLAQIEIIKGLLYVLLTALLLYYLVNRGIKRLEVSQEAFCKSEEQFGPWSRPQKRDTRFWTGRGKYSMPMCTTRS